MNDSLPIWAFQQAAADPNSYSKFLGRKQNQAANKNAINPRANTDKHFDITNSRHHVLHKIAQF
jgi:hypothetical protein